MSLDININDIKYVPILLKNELVYRVYQVKVLQTEGGPEHFCEIIDSSDGRSIGTLQHFITHELFDSMVGAYQKLQLLIDLFITDLQADIDFRQRKLSICREVKEMIAVDLKDIKPSLRAI